MNFLALWDGYGAVIVLGGSLLATALGSGRAEIAAMLRALAGLLRKPLDYATARAQVAHDIREMREKGVLQARPSHITDRDLARATDALVRSRSLHSMIAEHERVQRERDRLHQSAVRPVRLASEMAPVFGMAGTLFSLSQMQIGEVDNAAMFAGIGMAIVTTLYGLMLAHLVFAPLARLLERRHDDEACDRQLLIDWMASQLVGACPPSRTHSHLEQVA